MKLTLDIPDDLADEISPHTAKLGKAALEALAAKAYEDDLLSLEQVRRLLCLPSRWDAVALLKRHSVWPGQTAEDVLSDMRMLEEWRASRS